jgi:hypothetical protein
MFREFSCPSSGATTTAVAVSGLPSKRGDSSAVGRGRAGRPDHQIFFCLPRPARPRPTALLSPRFDGKPETPTAVVVASDDGRVNARNTLSCKQTSEQ